MARTGSTDRSNDHSPPWEFFNHSIDSSSDESMSTNHNGRHDPQPHMLDHKIYDSLQSEYHQPPEPPKVLLMTSVHQRQKIRALEAENHDLVIKVSQLEATVTDLESDVSKFKKVKRYLETKDSEQERYLGKTNEKIDSLMEEAFDLRQKLYKHASGEIKAKQDLELARRLNQTLMTNTSQKMEELERKAAGELRASKADNERKELVIQVYMAETDRLKQELEFAKEQMLMLAEQQHDMARELFERDAARVDEELPPYTADQGLINAPGLADASGVTSNAGLVGHGLVAGSIVTTLLSPPHRDSAATPELTDGSSPSSKSDTGGSCFRCSPIRGLAIRSLDQEFAKTPLLDDDLFTSSKADPSSPVIAVAGRSLDQELAEALLPDDVSFMSSEADTSSPIITVAGCSLDQELARTPQHDDDPFMSSKLNINGSIAAVAGYSSDQELGNISLLDDGPLMSSKSDISEVQFHSKGIQVDIEKKSNDKPQAQPEEVTASRSQMDLGEDFNRVGSAMAEDACAKAEHETFRKLSASECRYSPSWWSMVICLIASGALIYFAPNDQEFWRRANELTRRKVVAARDERWFAPVWLEGLKFSAQRAFGLECHMFG